MPDVFRNISPIETNAKCVQILNFNFFLKKMKKIPDLNGIIDRDLITD